jgi:hypothetical protein
METPVDGGDVWVTSRGMPYHGSTKSTDWRFDRLVAKHRGLNNVTFTVTNRSTVSGIGTSPGLRASFLAVLLWGEVVSTGREVEPAKLELRQALGDLREELQNLPA